MQSYPLGVLLADIDVISNSDPYACKFGVAASLGKVAYFVGGWLYCGETNPDRCVTYRVDHILMHSNTFLYIFDRYVLSRV